jgi:hypothetical protein
LANRRLAAAVRHRRDRLATPTARALAAALQRPPDGSMRALLARAGPFRAAPGVRDAFAFHNQATRPSEEEISQTRERFQKEVDVVKLLGIEAIRGALARTGVVVPIVGAVTLPGIVVSEIIRRVTGELTDRLLDSVAAGNAGAYGRCGGMAFAALDFFLAGRDVPDDATLADGPFRAFIFRRLLDSLDLNAGRFLGALAELHVLPVMSVVASGLIGVVAGAMIGGPVGAAFGALVAGGEDVLGLGGPKAAAERTRGELARLRDRLDAGPAWPIGLIYEDSAQAFDQHQVLTLRYQVLGEHRLELVVWDNNDGRAETTWTVDATGDALTIGGGGARDDQIRCIICSEYTPVIPTV